MSFTRLDTVNDIVTNPATLVTSTWSDNTNNLQVAHTSSNQANFASPTGSGQFFINVYHLATSSASPTAEVQYAVSYGHSAGSGSPDFTNDTGSFGLGASRCVYNQYRQLVFGDETQNFTFGTHTPQDIYVINVNRARYKNRLSLGTLSLHLSGATAGAGATTTIHLTDDSVSNTAIRTRRGLGLEYSIVSGSSGVYTGSEANQVGGSSSYGLFYPESGVIILNGDAFDLDLAPVRNTGASSNTDRNNRKLYEAISSSGHFIIDTEEDINSNFYFVRARNSEFNYTTNDSFSDTNNNITFTSMRNNPKVFITTVGLYNDGGDLLAVAKLSQPVAKDFTKEALIRVKLDY